MKLIANVDGTASSASVMRSSGIPAVDCVALDVASAYRSLPGEVDGVPVPMWVQAPIFFVFPEETQAARRRRLRRQAPGPSPPH